MIDAAPGLGEGEEEELPMAVFSIVVSPSHLMGGRGADVRQQQAGKLQLASNIQLNVRLQV